MAVSATLLRQRRVLAAQLEATVGTAETLAADDAVFNVFDVAIQPNIDYIERPGQAGFSPLPGVLGKRLGNVTFSIEAYGSGSAGGGASVPAWASVFLPPCGIIQSGSTGAFILSSTAPAGGTTAAAVRTATIGVFEDGVYKVLTGCMGNLGIALTAGQRAMLNFNFTGVWAAPTGVAIIAPNYPAVIPPRFAGGAVTLGSYAPILNQLNIDLGNNVVPRPDATKAAGVISSIITGRKVTGSMNPESDLVANRDNYGIWLAGTTAALSAAIGAGSDGNTITIAGPACQISNTQELDREGIQADTLSLAFVRSADAGDDELTITFS